MFVHIYKERERYPAGSFQERKPLPLYFGFVLAGPICTHAHAHAMGLGASILSKLVSVVLDAGFWGEPEGHVK